MENKRAREIVSSTNMIDVTYNGVPIYIEQINNDNETANVHPLNQPSKSQKVNLASLIER